MYDLPGRYAHRYLLNQKDKYLTATDEVRRLRGDLLMPSR